MASASAHVRGGLLGNSIQTITYSEPVEPPVAGTPLSKFHNRSLAVSLPDFTVKRCLPTPEFTCTFDAHHVKWKRNQGSRLFQAVDVFQVVVLTPNKNVPPNFSAFFTPAIQKYSDGSVVKWASTTVAQDCDPGGPPPCGPEGPAPLIRVIAH